VNQPVSTTNFSTVGLPPEQRVSSWQQYLSDALGNLKCRSVKPTEFQAATIGLQLAHIQIARVKTAKPVVVERPRKMIRQSPGNAIVLQFVLAGEAFIFLDDGIRTLRPGQLVVCDADRPYLGGYSAGYDELLLSVSRHAFQENSGRTDVEAPLFQSFSSRRGAVAASVAEQMRQALRPADKKAVEEGELLRLVGAMCNPDAEPPSSSYLAAARSFIDSKLSDPALCATKIAQAVGISPRHLSRIMAGAGSTVPQYVLGRRLDAARNMLQQPSFAAITIADISARCGFRSSAYFSSAFTARFGQRPSDIRRAAPNYRASGQLHRSA